MRNEKPALLSLIAVLGFLLAVDSSCERRQNKGEEENGQAVVDRLAKNDTVMGAMQDDWLSHHPEKGQSFEQYRKSIHRLPNEKEGKIYVQPIGRFSTVQNQVIVQTTHYLTIFFDRETVILPAVDDEKIPNLIRRYAGTNEEQLKTGPMLDFLSARLPKDGVTLMAITSKDLYPGDNWNYVFGQALPKSRVGVSSLFRFSKSLLDSREYRVCLNHMIKTSSHEIGHVFSCSHCTHASCLMNGSNSLLEAELRPNRLCSECLKKIQWRLQFDVRRRAKGLVNYFTSHAMRKDAIRAYNDLKALQ